MNLIPFFKIAAVVALSESLIFTFWWLASNDVTWMIFGFPLVIASLLFLEMVERLKMNERLKKLEAQNEQS